MEKLISAVKQVLILILQGYQKAISPYLGSRCRFFPRCSDYARSALEKKGILKGSALTLFRLSKCHPFHPGGVDFVE